jgi:hypothetical protein
VAIFISIDIVYFEEWGTFSVYFIVGELIIMWMLVIVPVLAGLVAFVVFLHFSGPMLIRWAKIVMEKLQEDIEELKELWRD